MTRVIRLFILGSILLSVSVSSAQNTVDKIITIAPYMSFQNYEHFKRLTLSTPDSYAEYIDGFDFEWGYTYKLNVKETTLAETWSDGTRYEFELNNIVSKTKESDSTTFKLLIDPNRYYYKLPPEEEYMNATLKQLNDSTYLYFERVEIEVPEQLREKFAPIAAGEKSQRGTFIYINEQRIRLVSL